LGEYEFDGLPRVVLLIKLTYPGPDKGAVVAEPGPVLLAGTVLRLLTLPRPIGRLPVVKVPQRSRPLAVLDRLIHGWLFSSGPAVDRLDGCAREDASAGRAPVSYRFYRKPRGT